MAVAATAGVGVLVLGTASAGARSDTATAPSATTAVSGDGSPAMNVLPASLVGGPGTSGQLVGFRPEHVEPAAGVGGDGATFEADVDVVEYLGDEQLVHLRLGDATIANLDVDERLRPGDRQAFRVRAERLHRFDAESEQALAG